MPRPGMRMRAKGIHVDAKSVCKRIKLIRGAACWKIGSPPVLRRSQYLASSSPACGKNHRCARSGGPCLTTGLWPSIRCRVWPFAALRCVRCGPDIQGPPRTANKLYVLRPGSRASQAKGRLNKFFHRKTAIEICEPM